MGVAETNGAVGINIGGTNSKNLDGNHYGLFGVINLPIYEYIGANISIHGHKSKYDYKDSNYEAESKSNNIGLNTSIFLRDSGLGKVGISIGYDRFTSKTTSNTINEYKSTNNAYHYSVFGAYYLNNFTIDTFFNRNFSKSSESDNSYNWNNAGVGASWYVLDNTNFHTGIQRNFETNDYSTSYSLSASQQLFKNTTEVSLCYIYDSHKDSHVNYFGVLMSYHFNLIRV